jgi:hypothetical protein
MAARRAALSATADLAGQADLRGDRLSGPGGVPVANGGALGRYTEYPRRDLDWFGAL